MDAIDQQIIAILRENARESYTAIAQRVGTSEGTVRARVKRLVEEGIIQRFTLRTTGGQLRALVEVTVTSNVHTAEVGRRIAEWEGVETVWEVTGENDIIVVADCPDAARLNEIIDKIRGIPGTQATRSRLILKEH